MKDEERTCPECGREVLGWEVPCPGCGQIPWETPAGQRVLWARRRWFSLQQSGPIAILLIVAVIIMLLGLLARIGVFL